MNPEWSAVIPNYNGEKTIGPCIEAIERAAQKTDKPGEIVVVDDASTDSGAKILQGYSERARIIFVDKNRGFGPTANRGFAEAQGRVVFLLNNDAIMKDDLIDRALRHFDDPDLFAVSFHARDEQGRTRAGRTAPDFKKGMLRSVDLPFDESGACVAPTFFASGGGAAFCLEKVRALGGFDPAYDPFYWEDVDLSWKAWARGWKVLFDPACHVFHPAKGVIAETQGSERVRFISHRNQWLLFWKNIREPDLWAAHFAFMALRAAGDMLALRFRIVRTLLAARRVLKEQKGKSVSLEATRSARQILRLIREEENIPKKEEPAG